MLHPADYFELIWGSYSDARHFKSNCFIKSREAAQQHGDESKALMETRKLEAVAEALEKFQNLMDAE